MSDFMGCGRNYAEEGAILGPAGDNFKDLRAERPKSGPKRDIRVRRLGDFRAAG